MRREADIRAAHEAHDFERSISLALKTYGNEVFGMLVTAVGDPSDAEEVFSIFCEDLCHGCASFEWRCSCRTWLYTLARYAMFRFLKDPHRLAERNLPLSRSPQIEQLAEQIRTSTAAHLRTETRESVRRLRDHLTPSERMLLVLRVDRHMSWQEVTQVMAEEDADPKRAERRLRKRFERIKDKLRRLASQQGLLESEDS